MSVPPAVESRLVLARQTRAWLNAVTADPLAPICVTLRAPGGYGKTAVLRELRRIHRAAGVEVLTPWQAEPESVDGNAVLLVDDAHLLDEARLRVLARLARERRPRLVVAYRPWPRPAALIEVCDLLRQAGPALTLPPLTAEQVGAYLTATVGAPPAPAVVDIVVAQTGGVPRFVVRLTAALARGGAWPGEADLAVPPAALAAFAGDLDELDGDVQRLLLAAEAGVGPHLDLLAALLDRPADGVCDVVAAARSTGLLGRDALVPMARLAVAALSPVALRVAVRQRLAELQLARGAPVLPLVRPLLGSDVGAGMARAFEAAGEEALGTDPALSARLFAAAAAAGRAAPARHAHAAALAGDLDCAIRLADRLLTAPDPPQRADGAVLTAMALAHRGQLARSADLYRWVDRGVSVPFAVVGLVGTGRLAEAEKVGRPPSADGPPTVLAAAASLMAQGVRESVTGSATAALSSLVQASALLEPAGLLSAAGTAALLPDSPAALAALVALHSGELDVGESVLERAIASDMGGALLSTRHRLLRAWLLMVRGHLAAARERLAAAGSGTAALPPREQLLAAALDVGLARRGTDLAALHRAWPDAAEAVLRHPVDLFTLLPLGELAIAAARLADGPRLSAHLDDADALLRSLGDPPLWSIALHWSRLHAAIIAEQPSAAEHQVVALAAHRGYSPYAVTVAAAAESWLAVLTGTVDPPSVEAAARGLHTVGMWWDAARLAGQAAIRTSDRRAMTTLLECARLLRGPSPGRQVAASTVDDPGEGEKTVLSRREEEVAHLVLAGLTYKEIGDRLFISAKTVEHHIARMRQRLGCTSRGDLLARLRMLTGAGTGEPGAGRVVPELAGQER